MNKMERFTQRALRVLSLAQEEVVRLHQHTLDTQHLLLGMVSEELGVAGRVLREMGLNSGGVREIVEKTAPTNTHVSAKTPLELSLETKNALELAVDEARRMGHHYIGTEHLLLGLIRLPDSGAAQILKHKGLSADEIRSKTRQVMQEPLSKAKDADPVSPPPSPMNRDVLKQHVLRVVIRDTRANEQKAEFTVTMDKLSDLIVSVVQGGEGQVADWSSGDNVIEVFVEKGKDE
jgi:ATP-dependent Clp protease ATP-binding subunit ClpA